MDEITQLKNKMLMHVYKVAEEHGPGQVDGEMVDMIKDLAEAEYYCRVTEAMDGQGAGQMGYRAGYEPMGYEPTGYEQQAMGYPMGYPQAQTMGYRDSMGRYASRRGYGSMGYADSVEGIRSMMNMASPEEKERMKAELRPMLGM